MTNTITAEQLVKREVHACVSALISTLANAHGSKGDNTELADLCEQAFELASPVLDYEEAAIDAGWKQSRLEYRYGKLITTGPRWWYRGRKPVLGEIDMRIPQARTAQEACEMDNIEPYEREVFEHWVVSSWLADKLIEKGEKVDKGFQGLCVWARTTTGQAIAYDWVIKQITADLNKPDEQGVMTQSCKTCRWFDPSFAPDEDEHEALGLCEWPADRLPYSLRWGNRERVAVCPLDGSDCPCYEPAP